MHSGHEIESNFCFLSGDAFPNAPKDRYPPGRGAGIGPLHAQTISDSALPLDEEEAQIAAIHHAIVVEVASSCAAPIG